MSVAFDTLKFARALQGKAKLSAEQAEGIAEAFADATGEQLATSADLISLGEKLAAATTAGMTAIIVRVEKADAATKAEFAAVKADRDAALAPMKAEQLLSRWMDGFHLAMTVAVLFILLRR